MSSYCGYYHHYASRAICSPHYWFSIISIQFYWSSHYFQNGNRRQFPSCKCWDCMPAAKPSRYPTFTPQNAWTQNEESNELRTHNVVYLMSVYQVNWGSREIPFLASARPATCSLVSQHTWLGLSLACGYFHLSWMLSPDQHTLMNVEFQSVPRFRVEFYEMGNSFYFSFLL